MLIRAAQIAIFSAIMFLSIHYQWTNNTYAAVAVAAFIAWFTVALCVAFYDRLRTGWLQ